MTDKKRISSADVQIAYLSKGMDGVLSLVEGHNRSRALIRQAFTSLQSRGADVSELESWIGKNIRFRSRGPLVGRRTYKVQQNGNRPFVLIPLQQINVAKGDNVWVNFSNEEIVIQPVS